MQDFEKLQAWEKFHDLTLRIYHHPGEEDADLSAQEPTTDNQQLTP